MSKYTTQVGFICEMKSGLPEYDEWIQIEGNENKTRLDYINAVVAESGNSVIGNYTIFDEQYRNVLNSKILKHYYMREICEETVVLWQLRINNTMNEIMPYYNKLYESELLDFNPFYDVDLTNRHDRTGNTIGNTNTNETDSRQNEDNRSGNVETSGETTTASENKNATHSDTNVDSTANETKSHLDRYSDTPQGGVNRLDLDENAYLTNARSIGETDESAQNSRQSADAVGTTDYNESGTTKGSSNSNEIAIGKSKGERERTDTNEVNSTEAYLEKITGKRGGLTYSKMLEEFRDTFINIDKMIIKELEDLFFGLWE